MEALVIVTQYAVLLIDAMALLVLVYGTAEAFVGVTRRVFVQSAEEGAIWLRYARWLVDGLTFQLAADIIQTSVAPSWDEIGRLSAGAVIRTFLNYFLERDLPAARSFEKERPEAPGA